MKTKYIHIRGAREHNLRNISLDIPRDKLIVITGLSGSGKSSLAFDTLFAEGQRRYVESLSAYARQFIAQLEKPDVDFIDGLSPAVAIQQRTASHNPRSTVATVTEIYDYLRLLYARIGTVHCPKCGREITKWHPEGITDKVMESISEGTRIMILAPVVRGRKGEHRSVINSIRKEGFVRVRIDGKIVSLDSDIHIDRKKPHTIDIVVDRLIMSVDIRARLFDSIETALRFGDGLVVIVNAGTSEEFLYSEMYACPVCGIGVPEITPRFFSFNSPYGACPECNGLGTKMQIDPELIVPDPNVSLAEGAIAPWGSLTGKIYAGQIREIGKHYGFSLFSPFKKIPKEAKQVILYGSGGKNFSFAYRSKRLRGEFTGAFEGVIPNLERRYRETQSAGVRMWIERFMNTVPCPVCGGTRLRAEALSVTVGEKNIAEVTAMSIKDAAEFFSFLRDILTKKKKEISRLILKEIRERLGFLNDVGVGYLTLDRKSHTLSGGEAQRIRLAQQIGSHLSGVLYILDEPSIGLHQRDNIRLLTTLEHLRDIGNTVVVVEHDRETIERADYIVDLGPGAGAAGGEVVAEGTPKQVAKVKKSYTGRYLAGTLRIETPKKRRAGSGKKLVLVGARGHNLKDITVEFPLGIFICVSGVSGSGKSTLINETLYPILARHYQKKHINPLFYKNIHGLVHLDKVIAIDQSPIGRTPRSNPATYTGVMTPIRELFASLPESRALGYKPGRFSFNVRGGRCEECQGQGQIRLEMHFLPDVYITCDACGGTRYNRETLAIKYKGRSIADVLDMTVEEALKFFKHIPAIASKLKVIRDVGLGYIKLGQSATTLSGGEAQRVKLSQELSRRETGNTFYILDEPTVGLHAYDVRILLRVLHTLVERGNTVLVIEHNLDVLKTADWIIDLGPEGGDEGGTVIAEGAPETVAKNPKSYTGRFLKKILEDGK